MKLTKQERAMKPRVRLRSLIARSGMDVPDFARATGIIRTNLHAYLKGKKGIGPKTAKRIEEVTGVSFHHFICAREDKS